MRTTWISFAAIYNMIFGFLRGFSGIAVLALSATVFDTMRGLSNLTGGLLGPLASISFIPILIGISMLIFGVLHGVAGYGLWEMKSWARVLAIVLHVLACLSGIAAVAMLAMGDLLVTTLIPILLLVADIVPCVGLFLPETTSAFDNRGMSNVGPTQAAAGVMMIPATYNAPQQFPPTDSIYGAAITLPPGAPPKPPVPSPPVPPTAVKPPVAATVPSTHYATPGTSGVMKTEIANAELPALAWLVERNGPRPGREHRLRTEVRIGRDPARCEVVLDDTKVSAEHAYIRMEGGEFILYDLASTNRTFVNGKETQKHVLRDGDEIGLGPNAILSFMAVTK